MRNTAESNHIEKLRPQSCGLVRGTLEALAFNAKASMGWLLFDLVLLILCAAFFYANNYVLSSYLNYSCPGTLIEYFAQCHLNDLIGGIAFMCYTNLLIGLVKPEARFKSPKATLAFMTLCGLFWEYIAPMFVANSTSDPLDIIFYIIGALAYYGMASLRKLINLNK